MRSGWFKESVRHSLAARGLKTGRSFFARKRMLTESEKLGIAMRKEGRMELAAEERQEPGVSEQMKPKPKMERLTTGGLTGNVRESGLLEKVSVLESSPRAVFARQVAVTRLSAEEQEELGRKLAELEKQQGLLSFPRGTGVRGEAKERVKELEREIRAMTEPSQEVELHAQRLMEKRARAGVAGAEEAAGKGEIDLLAKAIEEDVSLTPEKRTEKKMMLVQMVEKAKAKRNAEELEEERQRLRREAGK